MESVRPSSPTDPELAGLGAEGGADWKGWEWGGAWGGAGDCLGGAVIGEAGWGAGLGARAGWGWERPGKILPEWGLCSHYRVCCC